MQSVGEGCALPAYTNKKYDTVKTTDSALFLLAARICRKLHSEQAAQMFNALKLKPIVTHPQSQGKKLTLPHQLGCYHCHSADSLGDLRESTSQEAQTQNVLSLMQDCLQLSCIWFDQQCSLAGFHTLLKML